MRLNEHIGRSLVCSQSSNANCGSVALSTSKVLLVPYSEHHVPTYHEWMQDEVCFCIRETYSENMPSNTGVQELQQATASEPLTMPEEYDMQKSWRTDGDKLTFIVCLPVGEDFEKPIRAQSDDSPDRMIGDVNLFIVEDDEAEDATAAPLVGEVELMIARKDLHRSGYGRSTLLTFLYYVLSNLPSIVEEYRAPTSHPTGQMEYLRVKIGDTNERSLALFESIGFRKVKEEPNFFGEYELRLLVTNSAISELAKGKNFEMPTILQYHIKH